MDKATKMSERQVLQAELEELKQRHGILQLKHRDAMNSLFEAKKVADEAHEWENWRAGFSKILVYCNRVLGRKHDEYVTAYLKGRSL